ncbi:hypothetical protein [Pseudalkalibacillus salsuginis]|uniref:hypothetical protein n=1 Tax=Pseudalkalibacillus salsuginis TaxID=2910972 RepID=UPI001F33BBD1|nr:hypothetical protein [Pseudalkalibacillus salsuginis]MCF6409676.1 hypothetical protein [Pseudalkalibacillus salsuginis]
MKQTLLLVTLVSLSFLVVGCTTNHAKQRVEKYYTAFKNENYEKAFNHLLIFDKHYDAGTTLSESEAKDKYIKKINYLEQKGYQLKDFEIQEVRSDDGGPPIVQSLVTIKIDDKTKKVKEFIQVTENGLFIDLSEGDKYAHYRDGKMNVNIKKPK